jgi:hypothetical protein
MYLLKLILSYVAIKLKLELIKMQYDSILHNSFNQEALTTFHASLAVSQFSVLYKLA